MVRKWKLRHHLEWNWKTKNEWCGGYIYWISQLQWWYILCMCIVQLSVSISADWEDAITPLVNAGVFWSLFSFDFDDFPSNVKPCDSSNIQKSLLYYIFVSHSQWGRHYYSVSSVLVQSTTLARRGVYVAWLSEINENKSLNWKLRDWGSRGRIELRIVYKKIWRKISSTSHFPASSCCCTLRICLEGDKD